MDDRTIKIAQKAMDAMRRDDGMNFDLLYLLEKVGATDAEADMIAEELIAEGLVKKDYGGFNTTSKGRETNDLSAYFSHSKEISRLKDEDVRLSVEERKRNKKLSVGAFIISVISIMISLVAFIKSFL